MDEKQKELLMVSVTRGRLKCVQNKFNQYKLIIEDDNYFDYELLKAALNRKQQLIINFLLRSGCRVRHPNRIGCEDTPLHIAMTLQISGIITKILRSGASIYDKNANGETAILAGFKNGYYSAINEVLHFFYLHNVKYPIPHLLGTFKNLDPTKKDDILHFHIACIINNLDVVKQYLKCGFDINNPFNFDSVEVSGLNPLHYAATNKCYDLFECFVQHSDDLSIKNVDGETALDIFYYSSDFRSMIQKIFRNGSNAKFIHSVYSNEVSNFHLCCMANCPDLIQIFIDKGEDVNSAVSLDCPFHPGFTPLHLAIQYGCEKVVQLLLKNGADSSKVNNEGTTPLHLACASYYLHLDAVRSIIEILLDYKASVTAVDEKGCTPLHKIFWNQAHRETKILDMLMSKIPREVNYTDNEGLSHFHIICTRNDTSRVEDFLKSGIAVDHCVTVARGTSNRYSGFTALHFAVLYNQIDIVQVLLNWNAKVSLETEEFKFTPLHLACECNYMKIGDFYSQNKYVKSNNEPLNSDWTLHHANQLKIIELLLLHGADVEAKDFEGVTPMLRTCIINLQDFPILFTGNRDCIDNILTNEICFRTRKIIEILSNKANINARTEDQKSILHLINSNPFLWNSEELIEFLIIKGADINAADETGSTPLHEVVISKNPKLVKIFLKYKANVNAKTKDFITPLEIVCTTFSMQKSYIRDILPALLECGSDVNIWNRYGITLLQGAIENDLRNGTTFITEKLLYYGADINMEDSNGCLLDSYLLDSYILEDQVLFVDVFRIIFIHVQKLLALGCHVHEKVQKCCIKLRRQYNVLIAKRNTNDITNLDDIFDNCIEELHRMKLTKIDNYTFLYSILLLDMHELSKHVKNSTLVKILKDQNINDHFPLYSYLLKLQFKKGIIRSDVLESSNASLSFVIGLNFPDLCCDSILKYLTNEEIVNLKIAAPVMTRFKRKMNSNNFSATELPAKLQKKDKTEA